MNIISDTEKLMMRVLVGVCVVAAFALAVLK